MKIPIDYVVTKNEMAMDRESQTTLSKLITDLKGDMNISQFSIATGLNISTISRIIGGRILRPVSEDSLKKLADFAKNRSGITFEILKEANDKISQEAGLVSPRRSIYQLHMKEQKITQILASEIKLRNYEIWWNYNPPPLSEERYMRIIPDFLAVLKDRKTGSEQEKKWLFDIKICLRNTVYSGDLLAIRSIMDTISHYTFLGIQNDFVNKWSSYQVSIVLENSDLFYKLQETFQHIMTALPTSVILVNIEDNKIEKEFILKNTGNHKVQSVFESVVRRPVLGIKGVD